MTNPPKIIYKTDNVLVADNANENNPAKPVQILCKRVDVMGNSWWQVAEDNEMSVVVNYIISKK